MKYKQDLVLRTVSQSVPGLLNHIHLTEVHYRSPSFLILNFFFFLLLFFLLLPHTPCVYSLLFLYNLTLRISRW